MSRRKTRSALSRQIMPLEVHWMAEGKFTQNELMGCELAFWLADQLAGG